MGQVWSGLDECDTTRHAAYVSCDAKLSNPLSRMAAATHMCQTRRFARFPAGRVRQTLYFTMLPASSICQTSHFAMWLASRIRQTCFLRAASTKHRVVRSQRSPSHICKTPRTAMPWLIPQLAFIMRGGFSCIFADLPSWAGQPGLREPLEGLREAWIATGACCPALSACS